jgi:hypothetical protein
MYLYHIKVSKYVEVWYDTCLCLTVVGGDVHLAVVVFDYKRINILLFKKQKLVWFRYFFQL